MNYLIELHNYIFSALYSLTTYSTEFNFWMYIIAERLDWYIVFAGVLFIVLHRHGYRLNRPVFFSRASVVEGMYTTIGIGIAWLTSYILKMIFGIARPFLQFPEVVPLFLYGGYDSFPSGHATLFSALAAAIYFHHKSVGIIFGLFAFLIGVTRVIAGVHYPIDILVGWILGTLISWLVYRYLIQKN